MKLNDIYSKPLREVIETLNLSEMKVHTDDDGNIKAVELKYTEKEPESKKETNHPWA